MIYPRWPRLRCAAWEPGLVIPAPLREIQTISRICGGMALNRSASARSAAHSTSAAHHSAKRQAQGEQNAPGRGFRDGHRFGPESTRGGEDQAILIADVRVND